MVAMLTLYGSLLYIFVPALKETPADGLTFYILLALNLYLLYHFLICVVMSCLFLKDWYIDRKKEQQ